VGAADANRIVFLGPPGSGKGTQAVGLAEALGIPAISTGDMLRLAVAAGSELGGKVKAIMEAGELVSDELMADVVKDRLAHSDAEGGFLLDGYPRTEPQAHTLAGILEGASARLDHVVFIDVPEDELVKRALARQRADDKEDVIRERLRVYREKTAPLVEHYRGLGVLREIQGNQTIEEVAREIRNAVGGGA
jgi:adenylate kinase